MNKLELRDKVKEKKPDFLRQDAHKIKRLKKKWRKPKGIHSKMRLKFKGYRKLATVGYGSPKEVKGLTKEGLKIIVVKNVDDLKNVKDKAVVISRNVGLKKKVEILRKIKELKLKILNIENVDDFIKKVEELFKKKKEEIKRREEKKKRSKEESLKKAKEKEEEEKKETEEEKEKREMEEKRKVLEKKV